MANADTPRGLSVARDQASGVHTGGVGRYYIPATDTNAAYIGSLVKLTGDGDADGIPAVTANVASTNTFMGVVVGVDSTNRDDAVYHAGSTAGYVFVADDPGLLFEMQEDSVGGALTPADIGAEKNLQSITGGSTTSGYSSTEIDSSSSPAAGAGAVVVVGLVQREDNALGANAKWLVRINKHQSRDNAVSGI